MDSIRPNGFNILPTMVKHLVILNVIFYLATYLFSIKGIDLNDYLGMHFILAKDFHIWQFFTYMFMHGNLGHIFFNMFALWMFGASVEQVWGGKRFLFYYFITGLGAAVVQQIVWALMINSIAGTNGITIMQQVQFDVTINQMVTIGASGAVFGILLAFGMLFPNAPIYIYFLLPIKAKWLVILYGAAELFYGVFGSGDGVAHFAHLGGMLFGVIFILLWRKKRFDRYRIDDY